MRDVRFSYGDRVVLDGVSLEVRRGEVVALTGPNGAGKTTLAKIAAGPARAGRGRGRRPRRAAYLAQDPGRHLVTERVLDEVALGADVDERARARSRSSGSPRSSERHPRDLSSGERERLALAAVLATEPELLVLDEPTRGVDPERKEELARLLRAEAPERGTLVVTHDLPWAAEVADRVVELAVREASVPRLLVIALALLGAALVVRRRRARDRARRAALVVAGRRVVRVGTDSTRELAVVATLAAGAAAGRVLFAAMPGVQPVTVIAIVAGASLGARAGVATGALAAFVSNLFLGQGIWTPQQMLGWGACGVVGALLAPAAPQPLGARRGRARCSASRSAPAWTCGCGGASRRTRCLRSSPCSARGLWFDVSHAIGNVVIALAAGPELRRLLDRYGARLRTEVVWA